jgi:phosphoribosylformylglycinamidine synthase
LLFGEGTGRVVTATSEPEALLELAAAHGVPAARIGETGGASLVIGAEGEEPWIDLPVERLHRIWAAAIPRRLEAREEA